MRPALFTAIPKGFIPTEDIGQVFGFTEAAQDISFDGMVRSERPSAEDVIETLRPAVSSIPGINVYLQVPPTLSTTFQGVAQAFQLSLKGIIQFARSW